MNHLSAGFLDELVKRAGVLKFIAKHPIATLGGGAVLGMTGLSASKAYKEGLGAGERPRFLAASPGEPSAALYTNFHEMFPHEMSPKQKTELSKNFKEGLIRR